MLDSIVNLHNISFSYSGGGTVLSDVTFTLNEDERIGIIGPNGSGKTTLFYIIMGLLKPTSGHMEIFGKPVCDEKDYRLVRQQIGLLFQNSDDQLFSPTVMDDVAFGPLNLGKSPDEARTIVRETLAMLGIGSFENRISYRLSQGEKKLVALATVLAMKPKVLILDEPTAGLDETTAQRIIHVLNELNVSSIVASHDMGFIAKTAESLYGLRNGSLNHVDHEAAHSHVHIHKGGKYSHTHSDVG